MLACSCVREKAAACSGHTLLLFMYCTDPWQPHSLPQLPTGPSVEVPVDGRTFGRGSLAAAPTADMQAQCPVSTKQPLPQMPVAVCQRLPRPTSKVEASRRSLQAATLRSANCPDLKCLFAILRDLESSSRDLGRMQRMKDFFGPHSPRPDSRPVQRVQVQTSPDPLSSEIQNVVKTEEGA